MASQEGIQNLFFIFISSGAFFQVKKKVKADPPVN